MIDSAFFWLAISAGAFALLTPCVFPMVPITASYFAKHGGGDRKAAVRNALLFGAGIVGTFTAAGLATRCWSVPRAWLASPPIRG